MKLFHNMCMISLPIECYDKAIDLPPLLAVKRSKEHEMFVGEEVREFWNVLGAGTLNLLLCASLFISRTSGRIFRFGLYPGKKNNK